MTVQSVKLIVEVTAGLIPGEPEQEYTRRFTMTSAEWEEATQSRVAPSAHGELLAKLNGQALGYAGYLMLQPDRLNWVRTDWLWV